MFSQYFYCICDHVNTSTRFTYYYYALIIPLKMEYSETRFRRIKAHIELIYRI